KGTPGPKGPRGPRGPRGPAGPRGQQGPAGPSEAVATYNDGPIEVSSTTLKPVLTLAVPTPGSYVVSAKGFLAATKKGSGLTTCVLDAQGDQDRIQVQPVADEPGVFDFALEVVHTSSAAMTVTLSCSTVGDSVDVNWVKIVAIRVGKLT